MLVFTVKTGVETPSQNLYFYTCFTLVAYLIFSFRQTQKCKNPTMMTTMHLISTNYFLRRNTTGKSSTPMHIRGLVLNILTQSKENHGSFILQLKGEKSPISYLMVRELPVQTDITHAINNLVHDKTHTGHNSSTNHSC